jgi:hypothetical protein
MMHNAMHRWWKNHRNPPGGRRETSGRRFVEWRTPQPRYVVATRYAGLMEAFPQVHTRYYYWF